MREKERKREREREKEREREREREKDEKICIFLISSGARGEIPEEEEQPQTGTV
jgi:hypothetical protein